MVLSGGQFRCATFIGVISKHGASLKEGGLLGSQAVAQAYEKKGINVIAMSQVGVDFTRCVYYFADLHF